MPTDTEGDWAAINARLAGIPQTLEGYRLTLTEEAAKGRVSATRQYDEMAVQLRRWTGQEGESGDVFAGLVARSEVSEALRAELDMHAAATSRAFADFGLFVEDEMSPRGRAGEAVGREHYALASRYYLGAAVDLDETYAWG